MLGGICVAVGIVCSVSPRWELHGQDKFSFVLGEHKGVGDMSWIAPSAQYSSRLTNPVKRRRERSHTSILTLCNVPHKHPHSAMMLRVSPHAQSIPTVLSRQFGWMALRDDDDRRHNRNHAMGVLARITEGADKDEENHDSNVWRRKEWANRYRVDVSFDGACFCGWQTWKNSAGQNKTAHHHVQLVLQTVLRAADLALVSAGRTDAGVHVLCMPCHFDLPDSETHDAGFLKSAMVVRTI